MIYYIKDKHNSKKHIYDTKRLYGSEAELEGDDETLAALQAELARREAKGGEAPRTSATVKDSVEVPVQADEIIVIL